MASLRHGFGWNTVSLLVSVAIGLVVTPFLVARLGLPAYGVLTLATSAGGLLGRLDGGLTAAAVRYFGIAAGADDRKASADYFVTISVPMAAIGCVVGAPLFILAPQLAGAFHLAPALKPELVYATRITAVLLPLGLFQGVVSAVLSAHGDFRVLARSTVLTSAAYVAAVLLLVHHRHGVETLMRMALFLQLLTLLLTLPRALQHLNPLRGRLLPRSEVRALLAYSTRVQLAAVTAVINLQADALIVGAVLPVRYVAIYGVGAKLATLLRSIPLSLATPLVTRLTQTLGRSGPEETFREYARVQALWAGAAGAFCAVMIGASIFQVEAWLGHRFLAGGVVALMLQIGNLVNLLTMPLTVYLQAIGRPELDLRYGLLGAGLNLVLTVAFIWAGVYGIAGGTAAGQVIGSIALLWLARRAVSPDIPSFLTPVAWFAAAAGAAVTAVFGAALLALIPGYGSVYLVIVSLCLIPGACGFLFVHLGPHRTWKLAVDTVRSRSLTPMIESLSPLIS